MSKTQLAELLALPLEERVEVAEALWRSIEDEPIPEWQKQLLDERLREAEENPDAFVSWEEVGAEVLADLDRARST